MNPPSSSGIDLGSAAEWAGVLITGALLAWTHLAWRSERKHARELEAEEENHRRLQVASQISAWVQRVTPALREDESLPAGAQFAAGSWVLCIANGASFGLYDWRIRARVGPPETEIEQGADTHGPIGPGGQVIVALPRLDPAASPAVDLELVYRDESGRTWARGDSGLVELGECT